LSPEVQADIDGVDQQSHDTEMGSYEKADEHRASPVPDNSTSAGLSAASGELAAHPSNRGQPSSSEQKGLDWADLSDSDDDPDIGWEGWKERVLGPSRVSTEPAPSTELAGLKPSTKPRPSDKPAGPVQEQTVAPTPSESKLWSQVVSNRAAPEPRKKATAEPAAAASAEKANGTAWRSRTVTQLQMGAPQPDKSRPMTTSWRQSADQGGSATWSRVDGKGAERQAARQIATLRRPRPGQPNSEGYRVLNEPGELSEKTKGKRAERQAPRRTPSLGQHQPERS
jgi:hypothetical protein